jgi:hypothetical protein
MKRQSVSRAFVLTALTASLVSGELFALRALLSPGTAQTRAAGWVDRHRPSLPTAVDEFAQFPPRFQKLIFRSLPAASKAALWRQRVDRILTEDGSHLSQVEREFFSRLHASLVPEAFVADSRAFSELAAYCRTVKESLPLSHRRALSNFGEIAGLEGTTARRTIRNSLVPLRLTLTERIQSLFTVAAEGPPDCDCAVGSECCWSCNPEPTGVDFCENQSSGCGCFWIFECDGWGGC